MKVGVQPPVPFFEPFARAAAEMEMIDKEFLKLLQGMLGEQNMSLVAIRCLRDAIPKVDTTQPLIISSSRELQGNDVVLEIAEQA